VHVITPQSVQQCLKQSFLIHFGSAERFALLSSFKNPSAVFCHNFNQKGNCDILQFLALNYIQIHISASFKVPFSSILQIFWLGCYLFAIMQHMHVRTPQSVQGCLKQSFLIYFGSAERFALLSLFRNLSAVFCHNLN
jgi:hypothetical protein